MVSIKRTALLRLVRREKIFSQGLESLHRPSIYTVQPDAQANCVFKLLLDDSFDGAVVAASAAANAGVGVDDVHLVTLGDSLNGAVVSASAALDASVSNLVCHDNSLHMFIYHHW